jgi:hypothetical protein
MKHLTFAAVFFILFLTLFTKGESMAEEDTQLAEGLYAKFITYKGEILASLEFERILRIRPVAPAGVITTVSNFIGSLPIS